VAGETPPWSFDPILRGHKFTNAFRWLDYGSQFVITDLWNDGLPDYEFLWRCFLYRHTNLPSAWMAWAAETGDYPVSQDVEDLREFWHEYAAAGNRVFSGAYMIYPQSARKGTNKIDSILDLCIRVFEEGETRRDFFRVRTQRDRFMALRQNKGVADFMSMQILTDFGYSTEFREDEFVVPGPGAIKGAKALGLPPLDAIEWSRSAVTEPHAYGRPLSRMDHQNLLCEFSKYVRFSRAQTQPQAYTGTHTLRDFTVPPNWRKP
jgi:hypothetical protein